MPYDGLVMASVCHQLQSLLTGARVDKIYQPLREEVVILLSKPGARYRLLSSANATNARLHLTEHTKPNPSSPPIFCMVLRKHLEGGRVKEIRQQGIERVAHIDFDTRDELGRPAVKTLIVEVMGKHSNIILMDKTSRKIIDGVKRYSHGVSRHREVLPGRDYIPPPAQGKTLPIGLNEEYFINLLTKADIDTKLTDILLKTFDGFSPLMCREIVYRCDLPLETTLNHCGDYELRLLWKHFSTIANDLENGRFNPTLVLTNGGSPVDYSAFNLIQFEDCSLFHNSMSEILDDFYLKKDVYQKFHGKAQGLLTVLNREIKKITNKISIYRDSLKQAARGEDYRIFGELLTANIYRLEKGMETVELENFYHPEMDLLTIELDPQRTPSENAQHYFKKYIKAKNTIDASQQQLNHATGELHYLESIQTAVQQALTLDDLLEIEKELADQGYIKTIFNQDTRKDNKGGDKPQPLIYTSTDGYTILVGKNNRQNDYVTRKAQDYDLWFHTKDIPGSHVVIRTEGRKVPQQTLEQAALLAAYYSKARESSSVPVDYTYIKNVKKPNGAKPGMVIYDNQQTIIVNPHPEITNILKKE